MSKYQIQSRMVKSHLMNDEQVHKSLSIMRNAIDTIYNQEASKLSFEEVYRASYNLSVGKHGKKLYKEISESIKKWIFTYIK